MMTKLVCWAMVIAGTVLFVGTMWQAARGAMPWAMAFPLMVVQAGFTALNVVLFRGKLRVRKSFDELLDILHVTQNVLDVERRVTSHMAKDSFRIASLNSSRTSRLGMRSTLTPSG